MKLHHEVRKLEERKKEIISFMNDLDEQLRTKKIKKKHHAKLIEEKYPGKHKEQLITEIDVIIKDLENQYHTRQKKKLKYGAAALAIFALLTLIMYSGNQFLMQTPTGFAVGTKQASEIISYNQVFEQSTEAALALDNITGFRISGILEGTRATVKLRVGSTEYLVGEITPISQDSLITGMATEEEPSPYSISTDKQSYALGETVTITISPETADKSVYVAFGEENHKLDDGTNTYLPAAAGQYQAVALIVMPDDIVRIEANFTVEAAGQTPSEEPAAQEPVAEEPSPAEQPPANETATYDFTNLCTNTCSLEETSSPTLIVELEPGSKLTITELIITRNKENSQPVQIQTIPDITLGTGQETTLNLDEYFSDADNDNIEYDINDIPEISAAITQSELAISSMNPGIYTGYIYATDGDKLVTSNTFTITITEEPASNDNQTTNETGNETNETIPEVVVPVAEADSCSDPNPNKRPASCIEGREADYFKNAAIHLQNLDRKSIARVTAFGNMMIKGQLIENSQASPGSRDFRISYSPNGEMEMVAAWVDSETGDLHLKGNLFEEEFVLLPPSQNSFLIQNKKGTNLGYFDTQTGNLYLRGNLIQERADADIAED